MLSLKPVPQEYGTDNPHFSTPRGICNIFVPPYRRLLIH